MKYDAAKTEIYLTLSGEMIIDYPAKNGYIVPIKIRPKTQDYRLKTEGIAAPATKWRGSQ